MPDQTKLQRYAHLLASYALNIQPGQIVNVSTEVYHRDFAMMLGESCYRLGAKCVNYDLSDPRSLRQRIQLSKDEAYLDYAPSFLSERYRELVDQHAANIKIIGLEEPELLADLDPKRQNKVRMANYKAIKYFYTEGIGKSKSHWTVAAAATPKWGRRLFPDLGPVDAEEKLWEEIFRICRVDQENCIEVWKKHNQNLKRRAKTVNEMELKTIHFSGPGTDLTVGLSRKAVFKGGTELGPHEAEFEPNIPTEEIFTTPDWRRTSGKVRATRPFLVNGVLVKDLEMVYEEGVLTKFSASHGEDTFREYVDSDEGARKLGEVALVGVDSPIFQSGIVFEEILFDENAACHIAIGSAYKFCVQGGETMEQEELEKIGCNESSVHTDMMISSEEVNVTGETWAGASVELLQDGKWLI